MRIAFSLAPLVLLLTLGCDGTAVDVDAGDGMREDAGPSGRDGGLADPDGGPANDAGPRADSGVGVLDPDAIEGYGATSRGGEGGEVCVVDTLADDGPGSLRDCVLSRTGSGETVTPRVVEFSVGGTITLETDIDIEQPFLTIDGRTAPSPGITIAKVDPLDGEMVIQNSRRGVAHDIVIRYLRFDGGWSRADEMHDQNTATLAIDGENVDTPVTRVVLDHLVFTNATDSAGDMWGRISDVTVQWCLFLHNLHPMTISHSGDTQARERLSLHHNVFAYNHERNPQVRGRVIDLDYINNVVIHWKRFPGGYGVRLRERNGTVPTRVTLRGNFFDAMMAPESSVTFEPAVYPGDVFAEGNRTPTLSDADLSTVTSPFDAPGPASVSTVPVADLGRDMLPFVGLPVRTAEEQAALDEAARLISGG